MTFMTLSNGILYLCLVAASLSYGLITFDTMVVSVGLLMIYLNCSVK